MLTNNKHVEKSITHYLPDNAVLVEYKNFLIGGKKMRMLPVTKEIVERIISDSDMNKSVNFFYSKNSEDTPEPVSIKDANTLVTGKVVSSPQVAKEFENIAKNSYAYKILAMAHSKVAQAKENGKNEVSIIELHEIYDKEELKLSDLKSLDLAVKDILLRNFPSLYLKKPRKNWFFVVKLKNG